MKRVETLPADKREELFKRLDKDGDGGISREELGEIIKHRLGKHQLMPRLQELDTDHNGSINFEEFKAGEFFKKLPPERQAALFKRLDENGDGGISPRDHPADRPGPPHDPHHGFMMLDKNRDGFLTFDEFRQSMFVRKLPEAEQKERFDKLDRNQDAKLDATEFTHPEHKGEGKPDPQPQRTEAVPK